MRTKLIMMAVLVILALGASGSEGAYKEIRGTKTYIGTSADTKPSSSDEGSIYYETDAASQKLINTYRYTGSAWVLIKGTAASDTLSRTAAGAFPGWWVKGFDIVKFFFKTDGADTTVVQFQGIKLPGSWTNIGSPVTAVGNAEFSCDYGHGYPAAFDSARALVTDIAGTVTAMRLQYVGILSGE